MTVLNNTHNIGVRKSVYKKGSTINVNFEFLRNKKYLVVKAIDDSGKEKELAVGDDYKLDISDGLNGAYGVVTLLKDFDPSTEISLFREISATQKANMSSKVIFSSDFETALDRLTIMIQDLKILMNKRASEDNFGIVQIGANIDVDEGKISVPLATNNSFGVVKAGENIIVYEGQIIVNPATNFTKGVVNVGANIDVDDGLISVPLATNNIFGVVKAGDNIDVKDGLISVAAQVNSDWTASSGVSQILNKPALAPVAISGSYNHLSNKPVIPDAQVNSDWTASSGVSQILNKPSIPAAQVNSDWDASSGVAQILNKPALAPVAISGSYNHLVSKPNNASITSDGFMSKEDKIKLNATMKFPDGETGYTLPDASGRADKLITFDSGGNIDLHSTHDYDKWRNVRISTTESTVGLNLELPNPTERVNKVIGFSSDGKSVEMKTAGGTEQINSDWNATSGKAQILNKPVLAPVAISGSYNDLNNKITYSESFSLYDNTLHINTSDSENYKPGILYFSSYHSSPNKSGISCSMEPDGQTFLTLLPAASDSIGGIKVGSGLSINNDGVLSTTGGGESGEFINEPVITGEMVSERITFVDRGSQETTVTAAASFVINGKKTFLLGIIEHQSENQYDWIYRSNDCIKWNKISLDTLTRDSDVKCSFLQSRDNILYINTTLDVFCSSDGGNTFTKVLSLDKQTGFWGWSAYDNIIVIGRTGHIMISTDSGKTFEFFKPDIPDATLTMFVSPVYYQDKFFFIASGMGREKIMNLSVQDKKTNFNYTFINNHIPLSLTVEKNVMYAVVKDGTGYLQSFIYRSPHGSDFILMQTYNNMYTRLLGKENKWLLIDHDRQPWFCKNLSDNPIQVRYISFGGATECHYSRDTDLFVIYDTELLVSTTAYHIGTDNMSSFAAQSLGDVEGIMSEGEGSDIGSIMSDTGS